MIYTYNHTKRYDSSTQISNLTTMTYPTISWVSFCSDVYRVIYQSSNRCTSKSFCRSWPFWNCRADRCRRSTRCYSNRLMTMRLYCQCCQVSDQSSARCSYFDSIADSAICRVSYADGCLRLRPVRLGIYDPKASNCMTGSNWAGLVCS